MKALLLILLALGLQGCGAAGYLASEGITDPAILVGLVTVGALTFFSSLIIDTSGAELLAGLCLALAACAPAQAAPLNMQRAGDSICLLESRHLNNPLLAIGDGGKSRGECQISIDTAIWILPYAIKRGFVPTYLRTVAKDREAFKWFLHYAPVNRGLADAYLDWIRRNRGVRDITRLAYFWNAGAFSDRFGAKPDAVAFAGEVRIMYIGPPRASVKP